MDRSDSVNRREKSKRSLNITLKNQIYEFLIKKSNKFKLTLAYTKNDNLKTLRPWDEKTSRLNSVR